MSYEEYKNLDFSYEALVGAVRQALSKYNKENVMLHFSNKGKDACIMYVDKTQNFRLSENVSGDKISCQDILGLCESYGIGCIPA